MVYPVELPQLLPVSLGIIALQHGRWESALISFLLMGSAIGFLPYNFPPA